VTKFLRDNHFTDHSTRSTDTMSDHLKQILDTHAARTGTPGAAVGVYLDGEELYAYHGVTSVENPLPVDANTLFQFGSTGKTFTATAIMRLVEDGKINLDATVRTYLPEFRVADEDASANATVLNLLNHTAGWSGDFMGTGHDLGDDALAKFITAMSALAQENPLNAGVSYNNASLSVAGRVIEKVTGKRYEDAIADLIFKPLGMEHSFFFADDVMTRRFVVGHNATDGKFTVARPWGLPRAGAPAGGITANAGDQVAWIRFHLGDGTAPDGTRLLSQGNLERMRTPTAHMPGAALGDAVGISWMLRDVDGVQVVSHGGSTIGQQSAFEMVPEKKFGIAVLTNGGSAGSDLNHGVVRDVMAHYAGVVEKDPEASTRDSAALSDFLGGYETIAMAIEVSESDGGLKVAMTAKPAFLEAIGATAEDFAEPPVPIGMIGAEGDKFVVTEGSAKGMKGYFARNDAGEVSGVHMGGRLAGRV
jgi:CubicO group peptidase (beta-lactamase class C family)